MRKVLAVNIGNTNTQFAVVAENGDVENIKTVLTDSLSKDILIPGMPIALSSVVPAKNTIFAEYAPYIISLDSKTSVDFSLIDHRTMGADRIANAEALAHIAELPAMCIDCGTAVTIEVLDAECRLVGGIIAPGRKLSRQSLKLHTALLPYIDKFETRLPDTALGLTTESAITAGCDFGLVGMIQILIERIKGEVGGECSVYVTGGDASILLSSIPGLKQPPPHFTIRGIAEIFFLNQ